MPMTNWQSIWNRFYHKVPINPVNPNWFIAIAALKACKKEKKEKDKQNKLNGAIAISNGLIVSLDLLCIDEPRRQFVTYLNLFPLIIVRLCNSVAPGNNSKLSIFIDAAEELGIMLLVQAQLNPHMIYKSVQLPGRDVTSLGLSKALHDPSICLTFVTGIAVHGLTCYALYRVHILIMPIRSLYETIL